MSNQYQNARHFLFHLLIFPVPPTNLGGQCGFIQISYSLTLLVEAPSMSLDLKVSLPITIGTIPLQESMSTLAPPTGNGPLARTVASSGYTVPQFSNTGYVHPGIGAGAQNNLTAPPTGPQGSPWAVPPPVEQFNPYPNMPGSVMTVVEFHGEIHEIQYFFV